MSRGNRIIVSLVGIFIVLLALLSITYGYFLLRVQGNTNDTSISLRTANVSVTYGDGTKNIVAEDVEPGDKVYTKDFTVTNGGEDIVSYEVYMENVLNEFVHEEDLLMFITCKSNITGNECNGYGSGSVNDANSDGKISDSEVTFGTSIYPITNMKLISNTIKPASGSNRGEVHTYTIYLKFKDDGTNQSADIGKELKGKVQIYDPRDVVTISGMLTGAEEGYYVQLQSETKTSELKFEKEESEIKYYSYVFHGVEPDNHTLSIMKKGTETAIVQKAISVTKGTDASVNTDGSSIVINEGSSTVEMNISLSKSGETTNITTAAGEIKGTTLRDAILKDNIAKSDANVDFSKVPTNANKGLYYTNVNTQNNDTTYYFRGEVDNNYVVFGGNGICVYDGGGVLLPTGYLDPYSGSVTKEQCLSTEVYYKPPSAVTGTVGYESLEACDASLDEGYYEQCSSWSSSPETECQCTLAAEQATWLEGKLWRIARINEDGSVRLVNYDIESYGSTVIYGELNKNALIPLKADVSESAGFYLNDWYKTNLSSYSSMLSDTGFCTYSTSTYSDGKTYYDPYTRLTASTPTPQFGCTNRFTKATGGFDGPIGVITADELVYAGAPGKSWDKSLPFPSTQGYTMTIAYSDGAKLAVFDEYARIDETSQISIIPVINLNSDVEIKSGDGTLLNPYVVKTN